MQILPKILCFNLIITAWSEMLSSLDVPFERRHYLFWKTTVAPLLSTVLIDQAAELLHPVYACIAENPA